MAIFLVLNIKGNEATVETVTNNYDEALMAAADIADTDGHACVKKFNSIEEAKYWARTQKGE